LKRRTATFKSYSEANWIEFPHPTKFSTIHNDLNQELWTKSCYGLGLNLKDLKTRDFFLKPSQLLATHFLGRGGF
jgi:hypothetical protein